MTHNVVLPRALEATLDRAMQEDPVFARRWWRCLCRFAPDAARQLLRESGGGKVEECVSVTTERCTIGMYNGVFDATVARIDGELSDLPAH